MSGHRLTGSALDRIAHCPASAVLPHSEVPATKAAKYGTSLHNMLERRDPDFDAKLLGAGGPGLEELWPGEGGLHEVVLWFDPGSSQGGFRPKSPGTHRDYSDFPPGFIVGTIDYLHPGLGLVDDLKTGYPPPPTSLQLGLAAVALWDQAGPYDAVTVSITSVRERARGKVSRPVRNYRELQLPQVVGVRGRLRDLACAHDVLVRRRESGAALEVNPAPWACRYCPARSSCPNPWQYPDR